MNNHFIERKGQMPRTQKACKRNNQPSIGLNNLKQLTRSTRFDEKEVSNIDYN
jgi:hypothetical protein